MSTREIVVGDIGGTNARFAIATLDDDGALTLGAMTALKTADHPDFESAWRAYEDHLGRALPQAASLAVAAPVRGPVLSFRNNPWRIVREGLSDRLGLERLLVINDFGAAGHAVAALGPDAFRHVAGPDQPLPATGPISVVGPGTGLGVAVTLRAAGKPPLVLETEGSHVAFAPLDAFEQGLHARLLTRHGRVSNERVVCGHGLVAIHEAIVADEGGRPEPVGDADLWAAALDRIDPRASAALDRLCLCYGSVVGDLVLAHGSVGVALVGDLTARMIERLRVSGFASRFVSKGRYVEYMSAIPVRLVTHANPGLYGAAAAFAVEG